MYFDSGKKTARTINKAPKVMILGKSLTLQQRRNLKRNIPLLIMIVPVILYYIVFRYIPMGGLYMAFSEYSFQYGIFGSKFVGLDIFVKLFNSPNILNIIRNTALLSLAGLIIGFPAPIILALMLNEVRKMMYKRYVQTLVYLPHFFSWVVVGGLVTSLFATEGGPVNNILVALTGGEPYSFFYHSSAWVPIYLLSGVWKEAGFGTIIYLAALSAVDVGLYESAVLDGANKWQQIRHVTIPAIIPTIFILFILATGHLMEVGFEPIYILQNEAVTSVAEVISTYIFKYGIQQAQFSNATAMGLFDSIIGLILISTTNKIAKRFNYNLW